MSKTPERFLWAADLLNIKINQHILEIGCGTGLLAEQIIQRLSAGEFTAIDRSATMIEKAKKRNRHSIEAGKASFVVCDFKKINLLNSYYDTIVAFNVNFFWKDPKIELEIIRNTIKKTGRLFVFYQSPFEIDVRAAEPIKNKLLENGFGIIDIQIQKFEPTSAFCLIVQP